MISYRLNCLLSWLCSLSSRYKCHRHYARQLFFLSSVQKVLEEWQMDVDTSCKLHHNAPKEDSTSYKLK